ncbi:MAG: aminotransferase class V-fold PLP-dependent enzyme [Acholeplasmatales bacterium]|nr:aminotransferase class V-fold PLP-dependent enzyme [Acholeplasmatales bacterium]
MIYLDNAATTYPKPQCVYEAVNEAMHNFSFNSGRGSYAEARNTFKMIDDTRSKLAGLVSSKKDNVIFTSSATESLNNIIYGLDLKKGDTVFVSPFDHNAIVRTIYNTGAKIEIIPFNPKTWELDVSKYNDMLVLKKPKAIVISHISNVTGYELPYTKIFEMGKMHNTINVLDSAQGFGIYKVNPSNVDFVVFAGHKSLYAMFGIAGYINISEYPLNIVKVGGTGSDSLNVNMPSELPNRYEAGSLNSVGIYSICKSIEYLLQSDFEKKEKELTDYLLQKLSFLSNVRVYLPNNYISCGIISINVDGYKSDEVGTILSEDYNICVRTGYHCAPFIHDFLGCKEYAGTVRISIGIFNTKDDIDELITALEAL